MDAPQLFLSYNSADRQAVIAVQNLLRARGITTFLDRANLVTGLPWPQALEQGLRGARAVAVFIGRQLGGWQKREMWYALDRQVSEEKQGRAFPVVPVLLPGADLTPGFLFSNTWVDLRNGYDSFEAAEALGAIERTINATAPAPATAVERATVLCPYRGLEAFREEDSAFFAGRSAFAKQLLRFTAGKDLVAVVGPSGSGKSSVVQAGLVPLLRRERPPEKTWDTVTFTPGKEPFHRLASALSPLLEPDLDDEPDRLAKARKLGDHLASDQVRLADVIHRIIQKSNGTGRLLVVADQFEEIFTIAPVAARRPFAQALLRVLGSAPFTLLLTLRADFYSQIITLDRELSDRIASAQVNIGALTVNELRESIVAPARLVGVDFEPGLADRILADAGCEPGSLPLVEFALTELWSRRHGKTLMNPAYNEIGGVTGALAKRAETEFARFTQEEQTAARRLFDRLVRVPKPEEGAEETRQRIELPATDTVTENVVQTLARPEVRLLVTGRDDQTGTRTVEVAHEALIRSWKRLRGWLNEDREFLLWRQRLQVALEGHERSHGDTGSLLRGAPLAEAEHWLATQPWDLTDAERRFVDESIGLREREAEESEQRRRDEIAKAQQLKELAEARAETEQKRAAEQERHAAEQAGQVKRLRRFSLGVVVLLLLAIVAAASAFWQKAVARGRQLVATSISAESADPELSVLFAAQSIAATWAAGHTVLPEAEQQLHDQIMASHVRLTLRAHRSPVWSVAWSPDGKRLATANEEDTRVWDAETGKEMLTLSGHSSPARSVAWSPDGKRLVTGSNDGTAKVWDAETGKEVLTLSGHSRLVRSVAWSPDGKRLATANGKNTKVWDAETGKEVLTLSGHSTYVWSVAWSPDSRRLATADGLATAKVWDVETCRELRTVRGQSVAWSPDGKRLATNMAKVWDAESGKELLTLSGHREAVFSLVWSPDRKRLATGSNDNTAKVWDAESGKELLTLSGHRGAVWSVAWSPDGKRLATGGKDGTAKVWDAEPDKELLTLSGHRGAVWSVAWSPDGKRLATGSWDHTAKVWDAVSGKQLLTLDGHRDAVLSVAWSPDGGRLATGSRDETVKLWDAETGKELLTLRGHGNGPNGLDIFGFVFSVVWSPDGKRLATGSWDHTAKVWDTESGKELLTLRGHSDYVWSVVWSPDGKRLATGSQDGTAKVWDAESGKELLTLTGHRDGVWSVAWSADGKRLATGSQDGTAVVWNTASGKELLTLRGQPVASMAWSPDGERLAMAGGDRTTRVWSARSGRELLTLGGHTDNGRGVAWSPDGTLLATASDDGTVQVYSMDIRDLMALARQRVTAHPSEEGCKKYLNVSRCPPVPELHWW
jgi:WD40 repeat protein/KaiC/GvpD/RAD55 family RecA-like ATPase